MMTITSDVVCCFSCAGECSSWELAAGPELLQQGRGYPRDDRCENIMRLTTHPPLTPSLPLSTHAQSAKAQLPANLEIATRLRCAAGLAEMENRKYKVAARLFLQASFEHCKCSDVRTPTMLENPPHILTSHSPPFPPSSAALSLHCGSLRWTVCPSLL